MSHAADVLDRITERAAQSRPAAAAVGLLAAGNLLDALGQRRAARSAVGAGLVTAVPTAVSGWSDWSDTEGHERRIGALHSSANTVGLLLHAASLARRPRRGGAGLALLGSAVLGVGGWLGGHLAYALGVGVDTTAFQAGPTEWTDAGASADVSDAPAQVEVGGVPLVLVRHDGRLHALADRCTHRGGPLSDGRLVDGCLECPWHLSRFDVTDGAVHRGPATRPQPVYEVREVAGRIEVRRQEGRALRINPVGV
jgi:nitrite reductase/ring-hydroxylating ferredoxin subunit